MTKYNVFDFKNFNSPVLVETCNSKKEAESWVKEQKYPGDYEIEEDRTVNTPKSTYCGLCGKDVPYICEDTDHCSYYDDHPDYDVFG